MSFGPSLGSSCCICDEVISSEFLFVCLRFLYFTTPLIRYTLSGSSAQSHIVASVLQHVFLVGLVLSVRVIAARSEFHNEL